MSSILKEKTTVLKERPYSIFALYILLTSAVYLLPSANVRLPYIVVALLMLVSLVLVVFKMDLMQYGLVLLLVVLVSFFNNLIVQEMSIVGGVNEIIKYLRFFIPFFWGSFALTRCNPKQRLVISVVILFIIGIVVVNTIEALAENPMIARILAQDKTNDTTEIRMYRLNNVAGYNFSYMMGLIPIAFTWFSLKAKNRLHKVLGAIIVAISFYYIVQTMYTTLLILSSISVMSLILINSKHVTTKILIVVLGLTIFLNLEQFLKYLSDFFSFSQVLSIKFEQMYSAVKYDDIESVGARPRLIKIALQNWVKSPIFGMKNTNPSHSLVFELLQSSGLVGVGLWIMLFGMLWKKIYTQLKSQEKDTTMFNIGMGYVSLLSVLNDIRGSYEIAIIAFCVIPIFISVFSEIINGDALVFRKRPGRING